MQAAETGRRINQLYNDVNAIYGLLNTIHKTQGSHSREIESIKSSLTDVRATQMRHDNRLNELDVAIVGVSDQIKEMRVTQMRHENRFTEIAERFDVQDAKLDAQDAKLDAQGAKLDAHEAKLDEHDAKLTAIGERLHAHDKRFDAQDRKLDLILEALNVN